jgi:hypothetical protein
MKKQLLFASVLISFGASSQALNQTNEPTIGQSRVMYVCDTLTNDLSSTTGAGVTWNYAQILGLAGQTQIIEILDPAATTNAASFASSTKAFSIQGSLTNYYNSTATERVSQGFVFEEPSIGTVMATFGVDEQKTMTYPFALGTNCTDNFSGQLSFVFNGPQNPACTGVSYASIDGQGTLLLPNTTLTNVIRYKIVDTVNTQIVFGVPIDVEFIRTQYEYYDLANGNLPVFTLSKVAFQQAGGGIALFEQTIVLSSVDPLSDVGLNESETSNWGVFPNPSEGNVTLKGEFSANASASVYDLSGKEIYRNNSINNGQTIDLSSLNKGMYTLVLSNGTSKKSQKIVLR